MSHLDSTATLRVILAGRTGLDAALRRDPTIELIRARSVLEALGELSEPIDEESPSDCVLIIGGDVQGQARPQELAASVRIINQRCPVLLAAEGASAPGFDGAISPKSDSAHLRRMLAALTLGPAAAQEAPRPPQRTVPIAHKNPPVTHTPPGFMITSGPLPTSIRSVTNQPTSPNMPTIHVTPAAREPIVPRPVGPMTIATEMEPRPAASASLTALVDMLGDPLASDLHIARVEPTLGPTGVLLTTTADDRDLTTALLAGRGILPTATEMLRQRTGAADLAFYPVGSGPTPANAVPVSLGGKLQGHITSAIASPKMLDDGAAWLGGWLVLRDVYAEMRRSALTDPLTGAYNRRYLDRFLGAAMEQARQARHSMSVLMLDVDNFKSFNDRYGHAAGDEILTEIVKLLRAVVRDDDRVCRAGGDEFVVVFYEPNGPRDPRSRHPDSALAVAERFAKAISSHRFPKLEAQAVGYLAVSGGLATFPWEGLTAADLLAKADARLLESKQQGKNVITVGRAESR